jgi:FMN phosphatase YigB (HAD superfamily)
MLFVGVIFDMADVLYDATLWRRWLLRLVNQLGVPAEYEPFYHAWDHDYLADVHCGRRDYTEAFQTFLLARGLTWAQVDEVEASSRIQRENLDLNLRPWPGVVKTIAELGGQGLLLLAWSDACHPADELARQLDRLAVGNRFRAVLSSFDIECAQPSPQCYQAAVDALGLAAGQTLYVGHDAEHLAAARSFGLRTAAFNFQRAARADFYLTRFEDLLPLAKTGSLAPPAPQQQHPFAPDVRSDPSGLVTQGNRR